MNGLEQRLREAIDASVAGAEPSFDVLDAVRHRHRRRLMRVGAASGAAVAAVVGAAVFAGLPPGGLAHPRPAATAARIFPGGGRLLLVHAGDLMWLYPDGRTIRIARGFDGAKVSAGGLLAWKYTPRGPDYYTMRLDGSRRRLVLPAERGRRLDDIQVQLSPDGARLAYIRQQVLSQANVTYTLWVLDLATGQRVDLGPVWWSSLAWRDDTTILATSSDARALLLVNARTRSRSTYLTVTDAALVTAYEQARPGAGPPASIGSDGWSGSWTSLLAVWLTASTPRTPRPAEIVVAGTKALVTYAPKTPEQLSLTWGPVGLALLQTGAGDNPADWNTYAATLHGDRLSPPMPYGKDGATFNPAGNVIALQDSNQVTILPTPQPACTHTTRCLHFPAKYLIDKGKVLAWLR